ncbi:MAG TPA: ABC transporter permease [Vicinamibacterales bacterium]
MWQDLRIGIRMLRRSPGVSILAILCLTLGIGANAAVFSWIEGILLRPYPQVVNLERLFVLSGTSRSASKGTDVSWPDFDDLRRRCTLIEAFIAEKIVGTTLSVTGDRAERATGSVVSANYFDALGIHPLLGRGFDPIEETGRNAHPVVVISYQLWKDRFRGQPDIIGATQMLNGVRHTIVGVAPQDFYGTFVGYKFQFWVPASMQETFDPGGYKLEDRDARWIEGFVKLKPGVTVAQAQAEISAAARQLDSAYPTTNRGRGIQLLPVWQSPFNPMEALLPTLGIALAVVTSVLLIACANVGNLLLLKSFARRREMTIRLAVGAARRRLVQQLLTEGLILSAVAAAGGVVVAYWCRNALVLLFPPRGGTVLRLPAELDWRVLVLSVGVSVIATLLFGLAPALLTSKIDLVDALKAESGGVVGGRGKAWVRSGLVLIQVSLSFVLLVGAGLVIRSLEQMRTVNPGFATDGVLVTAIDVVSAGYDPSRARTFQDELSARFETMSGVQSAAFVRVAPFSYRGYSSAPIAVDGYEAPPDEAPVVDYDEVGPGYFATIGIPLVTGREFTRTDDENSAPVAVVNDVMAAQYWRGADPVGRRLQVKGRSMRVVGVARQSKYGNLLEPAKAFFYVPLRQNGLGSGLLIRTSMRPEAVATALAREVHALDANLSPSEVISMREQVARTTSAQTMAVRLLTVFGALAVLLAGIGLYGVMSSAVSQSTREFGLRLALGATANDLLRLVLSRGLVLSAVGVVLGAGAAIQLTRLLGNLLYKVSPRDPVAFATAFLVMAVASSAACFVPAWRATRTDPLLALRG